MSVIAYVGPQNIVLINAAVHKALWAGHCVTLVNPGRPDLLRTAGISVVEEKIGDKKIVYASARPNDYVAVAKAIVLANASTYELRYGERVELPDPWPTAAEWPSKALELEAECECRDKAVPLAWSVLSRIHYNVYPEAPGGQDAIELLNRLMNALAYDALAVDRIWEVL